MLKHKALDFPQAISAHKAAILVTVRDNKDATSLDDSSRLAKLEALHMSVQVLTKLHSPMLVDFGPSQSLLSPQEITAVADDRLPVPILIHPFPFNAKSPDGQTKEGIAAIHAQHLIGAELELEAVPSHMPMSERINTLTTLITLMMEDVLTLEHGDSLQTDKDETVWIRREEGSIADGPPRIIVSFDPAQSVGTESQSRGQMTFQERIAQLKQKTSENSYPPAVDLRSSAQGADVFQESNKELLDRVQSTISADDGQKKKRSISAPVLLLMVTLFAGYFAFTDSSVLLEKLNGIFAAPAAEETEPDIEVSIMRGSLAGGGGVVGKTVKAPDQFD